MNDITLKIINIDENNREEKLEKAVEGLSKALGVPVTVKPSKGRGGEPYRFYAQEQLIETWKDYFSRVFDQMYFGVCAYLGLPAVTTFTKALPEEDPAPLRIMGKVIFSPETGKPLTVGDFNKMVRSIEKFFKRTMTGKERELVLDNMKVGKALTRMLSQNTEDIVRKMRVEDVKYRGYNWDELPDNWKRYQEIFSPSDYEMSQMKIIEDQIGNKITGVEDDIIKRVKDVYYTGVREKRDKNRISQDLFDEIGKVNHDIRRITEYESVSLNNQAMLWEERANSAPGEKLYFKREEILDGVTCDFCKKIMGTIALYVDTPLKSEKIDDPVASVAIWDGKTNIGRGPKNWWVPYGPVHPSCRGSWSRYYPELEELAKKKPEGGGESLADMAERMNRRAARKSELWGEAMAEAGDDFEKIQELFEEKVAEETAEGKL
jgi:hypothetical protein